MVRRIAVMDNCLILIVSLQSLLSICLLEFITSSSLETEEDVDDAVDVARIDCTIEVAVNNARAELAQQEFVNDCVDVACIDQRVVISVPV